MARFHFSGIAVVFSLSLFFLNLPFSAGQDVPTTPLATESANESESAEPFKIKVSVEEVRLDVVVLDKKGNPITDLTAAEFEVYQDGKQQQVLSSVYIDSQADVFEQPVATGKDVPNLSQLSAPALKKEAVNRTIIFLIDDYAMSFENGYYTKMALRNFAEKQMQSGDLVALIRTGYGNSALNMFYSDKRELLARINALPTTNAIKPIDLGGNASLYSPNTRNTVLAEQRELDRRTLLNLMSNLSYSLRVVQNLPGRKIINAITMALTMDTIKYDSDGSNVMSIQQMQHSDEPYIQKEMLKLADEALWAGVVINFLGVEGLKNFRSFGADASISMAHVMLPLLQQYDQLQFRLPINPIPDLTGGVIVQDRNFFLGGLGKETESLMRGYYLVSYAPPPDTFEKRDRNDDGYRRSKISVKRKDAVVHTRDGFFGRLESELEDSTPENPLYAAIYSPFQSTDINVDIAAGYVKDARAGYLVRSWIHVDPEDVNIAETEEGNRIALDVVYVTSDINGKIQDSRQIEFTLSKTSIDWVRKHGLRFSMLLPVKKPGPYYIRISVQDKESGKVGSAYQFLEIPDIGKKELALSNTFMITSADDLAWMRSDVTEEVTKGIFFPMIQEEEVRSPALRTYKSGDALHTLTMLYNADAKAIARSEIEVQTILYKDGKEVQRGNPVTINPDDVNGSDNAVQLLRRFALGKEITPGDYMLQLVAIDKKNNKKKEGIAAQALSFTVID